MIALVSTPTNHSTSAVSGPSNLADEVIRLGSRTLLLHGKLCGANIRECSCEEVVHIIPPASFDEVWIPMIGLALIIMHNKV